jgi:anaerobic ribonucleoside-triphosphate reductase activating protein
VRIAGTLPCSLVNGDGVRYVVFTQGCAHQCAGCHNPETWDFSGGVEIDPKWIAYDYARHAHLLDGITLSGGDPFYQQGSCLTLLKQLPKGTNVWVYTGFEYEEIKDTALAKAADALVTGPYVEALRCEGKMYGSSNQEIHRRGEV